MKGIHFISRDRGKRRGREKRKENKDSASILYKKRELEWKQNAEMQRQEQGYLVNLLRVKTP